MHWILVMQAGTVFVNCPGAVDDTLPFGGYKESGIGRDKGEAALHHYTISKTVYQASCLSVLLPYVFFLSHSSSLSNLSK